MRGLRSWRLAAALLLAASPLAGARAGQPTESTAAADVAETPSQNWFSRWFGSRPNTARGKAPQKKADSRPAKDDKKPTAEGRLAASADAREREQAAYFRRLAVCDQLMEIAAQTDDDALRQQAEQLSDRAWQAYCQRLARLPGGDAFKTAGKIVENSDRRQNSRLDTRSLGESPEAKEHPPASPSPTVEGGSGRGPAKEETPKEEMP